MMGINSSKKTLLVVTGSLLLAGTLFAVRAQFFKKGEEPLVSVKEVAPPLPTKRPPLPTVEAGDLSQEIKNEPVVSNASLPEIKSTMRSLREAFSQMKQFKGRDKNTDRKAGKAEKEELSQKLKALRKEAREMIRGSEIARRELLEAIIGESDPYVKKQLAMLLRDLEPEVQLKYSNELAHDASAESQKVAVEMLSNLHTRDSLDNLVAMADNASLDPGVREGAVQGIGRSIAFAYDDAKYQADARRSLQEFTQPQYQPEIRENAYRAMFSQTTFSAEDENFIAEAVQKESDPRVKRMAEFVQKVITARKNSAQHPKTNP